MSLHEEVSSFIDANILHSDLWDALDASRKKKAVNNASMNLYNYYTRFDEVERPIPAEAVVYQTLWILQIDDSFQRAERGVTNLSVAGINMSIAQRDRSIAPEVLRMLGRRIGSYDLPIKDTFRHRNNPKYARRGF